MFSFRLGWLKESSASEGSVSVSSSSPDSLTFFRSANQISISSLSLFKMVWRTLFPSSVVLISPWDNTSWVWGGVMIKLFFTTIWSDLLVISSSDWMVWPSFREWR